MLDLSPVWRIIHTAANKVDNGTEKPSFFQSTIKTILSGNCLGCDVCKQDAIDFVNSNPVSSIDEPNHCYLKWTWIFHNHVNKKTGKEIFSWNDCLSIYSGGLNVSTCQKGCRPATLKHRPIKDENLLAQNQSYMKWFSPQLD